MTTPTDVEPADAIDRLPERATYADVADALHISVRQLKRHVGRGEITVIQPGGHGRFALIERAEARRFDDARRRAAEREADRKRRRAAQRKGPGTTPHPR